MTRRNAATDGEQLARFEEWYATQPDLPEGERPKYRAFDGVGLITLFLILAFAGFFIPFFLLLTGILETAIGLAMMIVLPMGAIGLMFAAHITMQAFHDMHYRHRLTELGWAGYDRELRYWQLAGDQDFGDLARTNMQVHWKMYNSVYGGYPPVFEQIKKEASKTPERRPTNDPELDALEDMLDNATPGPRHKIALAPPRRLARLLALEKASREAKGKRFIAETSIPATRAIGPNSAGWFSNMSITDEETAAVMAEITPYFTAVGLKVVKCWIGWRGMSMGVGGNYESLAVVVRVI